MHEVAVALAGLLAGSAQTEYSRVLSVHQLDSSSIEGSARSFASEKHVQNSSLSCSCEFGCS